MPLTVIVVDDSAVMRAMILRTLRLSGLPLGETVCCSNGQEGLDAIRARRPDLALVDINMPVMDGEQMIDHLRADAKTASVPVVVVSTESSDARVERLRAKGARFVHKPFTPEQLRDTILALTGIPNEQTATAARASDNLDF